ncbi:DUF4279 domain-containing protein [Nocardia pseudovaccinii]|uniref:DUF4279 domain-containing protein n=1 Tax=Nocardia pseudovaccinii TaxID=189540 RepID=UPI0007A4CA5A|nr:DUF4279 domain-containing protein [Nocardia pseudovaccinii]
MKVRQYCYFALKSVELSAADIACSLQMDADEVLVMGSRSAEHCIPRCHAWKIVRRSTESVDDQIQHLVDRLRPVRGRLVSLVAETEVSPVMQVVRCFHDPDGVNAAPSTTQFDLASRWPRPRGWHQSLPVLEFLSSTRTELDVDEYDFSPDEGESIDE